MNQGPSWADQWIRIPTKAMVFANDRNQMWAYINPQAISHIDYTVSGPQDKSVPTITIYMQNGTTYTLLNATAVNWRDYLNGHALDLTGYPPLPGEGAGNAPR